MNSSHKSRPSRNNAGEFFQRGVQFHTAGQVSQAVSMYEKALAADPGYAPALHHLGMILWQKGSYDSALRHVQKAISKAPRDHGAHNTLGLIYTSQQNYTAAERSFSKALSLKADYAEAWFNLARLCVIQFDWKRAFEASTRLLAVRPDHAIGRLLNLAAKAELGRVHELDAEAENIFKAMPHNPLSLYLMGKIYFRWSRAQLALEAFEAALTIDPNHMLSLYGKAQALLELDEKDTAKDVLMAVLDANPAYMGALRQLAQLHRFQEGDEVHERLQKAWQYRKTVDPLQQAELHYAWGRYYADTGDTEKTFSSWHKAGAAKLAGRPYKLDDDRALCAHLKNLFPVCPSVRCNGKVNEFTPIFIVGMPRSGTTLMEQIFASHHAVGAGGETRFLEFALGDDAVQRDIVSCTGADDKGLVRAANDYRKHLAALVPDGRFKTDKMPYNYLYLGFIYMLFPQAKIIHMQRHPMDTCLSCFGLSFNSGHGWSYNLKDLGRYYTQYYELMKHFARGCFY